MGHDTWDELLPFCALGVLEAGEASGLQAHLRQGCRQCSADLLAFEEVAADLGCSAPLVAPPESCRRGILRRAASAPQPGAESGARLDEPPQAGAGVPIGAAGGVTIVHGGEGVWEETGIAGVRFKPLRADAEDDLTTMLVRMQPGASYPRHRHAHAEECFVIEGDLHVGDAVMRSGDFQRAEEGSVHVQQFTVGGCLLFVTASLADEMLA